MLQRFQKKSCVWKRNKSQLVSFTETDLWKRLEVNNDQSIVTAGEKINSLLTLKKINALPNFSISFWKILTTAHWKLVQCSTRWNCCTCYPNQKILAWTRNCQIDPKIKRCPVGEAKTIFGNMFNSKKTTALILFTEQAGGFMSYNKGTFWVYFVELSCLPCETIHLSMMFCCPYSLGDTVQSTYYDTSRTSICRF